MKFHDKKKTKLFLLFFIFLSLFGLGKVFGDSRRLGLIFFRFPFWWFYIIRSGFGFVYFHVGQWLYAEARNIWFHQFEHEFFVLDICRVQAQADGDLIECPENDAFVLLGVVLENEIARLVYINILPYLHTHIPLHCK